VILCGGAVNTPQLLMLSGIGPGEHLQSHGIETIYDAPGVGQNLQDHLKVGFAYRCRSPITVNDVMQSKLRMVRAGLEYALFRRGPLALSAASAGIFARTRPELATPDVQFHFINFSSDTSAAELHPFSGFTQHVCQLRPESRGVIQLRSPDPAVAPAIHPNYLAEELDRRTIVAGLKLARRIAARPVLRHYIESEHAPGEAVQSDDEFLDYARRTGSTVFHPVGTARMGRDEMAVVDDQLRVHGIEALRVADASIMPTLVSGNTNAACIMIGEKCADLVRGKELLRAA
jgi:choline dehydrogenase-like flavoprotein